jgi:hypothetical protein
MVVVFWCESNDTILSSVEQIVCQHVSEHEASRVVSVARGDQSEEYKVSVCVEVCWIRSRIVVDDRSRRCGESRPANGGQ